MSKTTIELGENYIRLCESTLQGNKVSLTSYAEQQNTPLFFNLLSEKTVGDTAKIIDTLYASSKSTNKNINVVIPDAYTYAQITQMPRLKEKELLSAIRYQADQFIPLPLEEAALDLEILYEDKTNNNLLVLIVAASQKIITSITNLVEESGLIPDSIENELSASGRYLTQFYRPPVDKKGTIFINLGYSTSSLYFFHNKLSLLTDSHVIKIGLELFLKEIKANINVDNQKATEALKTIGFNAAASVNMTDILNPVITDLQMEIKKFMVAIEEKYKVVVDQVYVYNNAYQINKFSDALTQHLGVSTALYDTSNAVIKTNQTLNSTVSPSSLVTVIGGSLK